MSAEPHHLYSQLPAIDRLLREPEMAPLLDEYGAALLTETLRKMQMQAREIIRQTQALPHWHSRWISELRHCLNQRQPALKPVLT